MQVVEQILSRSRPGLLVSVRSADEALAALAGGADVIDVKEPNRGPLGAANHETIAEVVRVVSGRVPVTAAAGELGELLPALASNLLRPLPAGVALVKIGLSHCGPSRDWPSQWRRATRALRNSANRCHALPVAVVYADWQAAKAPRPERIHSAALDIGCRVILVDTWEKSSGTLTEHWPTEKLKSYVHHVHGSDLAIVLAGSLSRANLLTAAELRPDLLAVRGAVCNGGRSGTVSQVRVTDLRQALDRLNYASNWHAMSSGEVPSNVPLRHQKFS
jgi:(5-formylfuran-3-yl)methyl phosphate synthase